MAKAKTAEVVAEDAAVSITPPAPRKKRGKPVAIEVHEVKTVWSEEKVIGEKPKAPPKRREPEYEPEEDAGDEDEDDNLPEEVADFLRNQGESSSDVLMEVRFIRDGNGRVRPNEGIYCGTFNFNPDTYLEDLALMELAPPNKPARFVLRLKQDGRYITGGTINAEVLGASIEKKLAAGTITATPAVHNPAPVVVQAQTAPSEPPDPMAGIRQTLSLLKEFQGIGLIPKLERSHQEPVIVQPQNTDPKLELARFVMETPELAKQAIGNLVGGDMAQAKAGVTEMIVSGAIDLVQSLVPAVGPAVANFFNARAQAEQMRAYQIQQQINGLQAAAPLPEQSQVIPQQMPMPEAAPVEPLPIQSQQEVPPEDELFARILAACARRKLLKPEVAARNLLDYTDQFTHPETGYNKFNEAYDIFCTNDVKVIISLAAQSNPIAARMASEPDTEGWLTALQGELRKELNGDEQDNEPS